MHEFQVGYFFAPSRKRKSVSNVVLFSWLERVVTLVSAVLNMGVQFSKDNSTLLKTKTNVAPRAKFRYFLFSFLVFAGVY